LQSPEERPDGPGVRHGKGLGVTSPKQDEFDFGDPRQSRITHALRNAPGSVRRAVPLSDTDKLTLAGMDSFALQVAGEAAILRPLQAQQHAAKRIAAFVAMLDDVSPDFADETTRYLTDAVKRLNK